MRLQIMVHQRQIDVTLLNRMLSACKQYWIMILFLTLTLTGATLSVWVSQKHWGLTGDYYPNTEWEGTPLVSRIDLIPYLKGDDGATVVSTPVYSAKWSGWIVIARAGTYRFATFSDDGSYLVVDGRVVVDNGGLHQIRKVSQEISLDKGVYPIEIRYFEAGGFSFIQALWTPPGQAEQPLPAHVLFAEPPGAFDRVARTGFFLLSKILTVVWIGLGIGVGGLGCVILREPISALLKRDAWWLFVLCGLAFWISASSSIHYADSDPAGNFLISQAIVREGTIKADVYLEMEQYKDYPWTLSENNGHYYYYYPLGTSIYAVPFVYLANLFGKDMATIEDNVWLHETLAALTLALICCATYLLCRCYLKVFFSAICTVAFVFGSSFMSSLGTALWSTNLEIVFILLSLLLIVRDRQNRASLNPYLLGFLLFSAYFCRPTAAIGIALVFGYLLLSGRQAALIRVAGTSGLLLVMFSIFWLLECQQILPDYYWPSKNIGYQALAESDQIWFGFYATLFSASRGLLVFSPFLLLPIIGGLYRIKQLFRNFLFRMASLGIVLHWVMISRFPVWHGGACFGPRLFTDALPSMLLLTLLVADSIKSSPPVVRRISGGLFVLLTIWSVFIHSYQGMYNVHTKMWNIYPGWDVHYVLDWKYPQFLASEERLIQRNIEYEERLRVIDD